jgi:hypothetical protein
MEDMAPVIIGAIAGAALGWLIAALRSSATHHGGGWFSFTGMGCFTQLLLMIVLAAIGALVGFIIGG